VLSVGEPGAGNEQGLLSMAFAPDFHLSGRFYVAYTGNGAGDLHVAEVTASGDSADPATLRNVITVPHTGPSQNHNAGQLQFGRDGLLYISTGDGGGGPPAQDPADLLGKLLRIAPSVGGGYQVPADNPFTGVGGVRPEIWSAGLRNPWRFSFDRLTSDLLLSDVGQGTFEEVNFSAAPLAGRGVNFGWPCREGPGPGPNPGLCGGGSAGLTDPTFSYSSLSSVPECAVTGGYVVRDPGLEELYGRYVYADLCLGVVRSNEPSNPFGTDRSEGLTVDTPTTFGEDRCGRVYVAARSGPVFRLADGTPAECPPPDRTAPGLSLDAKRRHDIERRRQVRVAAVSDESGALDLNSVVTKGGNEKELFALDPQIASLQAGTPTQLKLKLKRRKARRCERLIEDGKRVKIQLSAAATDAAGNEGQTVEAEVRLVVD
jgi:Glucose / Sorbosone dehydrogenase